jgi:hypothetical protein
MIDVTTDIETVVDRALGLLIDKRHASPVTNAIKLSLRREGERLCWRHGRDALIEAAMLVTIRNPNSSRYARTALLQDLWATIDMQHAPVLAVRDIPTIVPCSDMVTGETQRRSIMRVKKTKKTKKTAKKTKRAAHAKQAAVKRSA